MEIFSNPMFSDPAPDEDEKPEPRKSQASQEIMNQARSSVNSILSKFKPGGKGPKKDKETLNKPLETLLEETQHGEETIDKNISIIESESEISKLKYENSLLGFTNKELLVKLDESEKEMHNLKDFLKTSDEKIAALNQRLMEEEGRYQGVSEDLVRIEEDNRRLLELENGLKGHLMEKEKETEDYVKSLKEKENVIKEIEQNFKALNSRLEEERSKLTGFYEDQITGLKDKIKTMESSIESFISKESFINEMHNTLEKEKANFQSNLQMFEETLSARDHKIQELQGILAQKENLLLRLEGNKVLMSSEKQEISQEIQVLTEKYETDINEYKQREQALMQENRELLDNFENKRNEFIKKEEILIEEKKSLEEGIRLKDIELYQEKEGICEERLKLSNERLELEQKMRRIQQEIEDYQSKTNYLTTDNTSITLQLQELEAEKTAWLEEKTHLESRLMEEKAKELTLFSNDLEAKTQTINVKLEEYEIENLVIKEKASQLETHVQSLRSQLDGLSKEKEVLVRQLIEEKQQFQKEKQAIIDQKRHYEANYKKIEGSIQEKETMIQELMGNLIEKESYIRNSVIEKDSEFSKLKENYEQEIGFYKKSEAEKNMIYENLMNKLLQGEKLLQTKQNTLTYFQENYQKILKEKEALEAQLKTKSENLLVTNQKLENSQETLSNLDKRLKEYSKNLEMLQKDLEARGQEKENALKKVEETYELKLKTEKSTLEAKLREKEVETLHLRQELNKQRLQLEEKATEATNKSLRLEQEYQNKLLEISKGSEHTQKETMKKLEDLLEKKTKDLTAKEKRVYELEESIKSRDREIKELRDSNRELQEKVASFLKEKEAYLKENASFREQKLRVFEARMQEMQVRFNGEIENLSMQKLRLREEYELKLDTKNKELTELKSLRKTLEEKLLIATKDKDLSTKEATLLKDRLVKAGALGNEETGNWITNVTKELKIECRMLQEEKKRLIEDYESRLKSKDDEIEALKQQRSEIHEEKVKKSGYNESPTIDRSHHSKKQVSFKKKPLFKENEVFNDVNRLKEKVKGLLVCYQRLLDALKEKPNIDINLRKYLSEPVNEILKLYMKILSMYYEVSPVDFFENNFFLRKASLLSIDQCNNLQNGYLESGGNLEKDLNENMRNCLDFIIEFYSYTDPLMLHLKAIRKRGTYVNAKGPRGAVEPLPEGFCISLEPMVEEEDDSDKSKGKKNNEISIKIFKVLEKINGNLQSIKSPKIKEKVLIFCIIIKSFINNESLGTTKGTVLKEIEDIKGELEGQRYFVALFTRVERLLGILNGDALDNSVKEDVLFENVESDLES